jgi:hypothetical protein
LLIGDKRHLDRSMVYIRKVTVRKKNGKVYTYRYLQVSWREGKRIRTKHLGRVDQAQIATQQEPPRYGRSRKKIKRL